MAEDWRVTITLDDESGEELGSRLQEHELEEEASFGGRVAVSADTSHVFLYADTRAAADGARKIVENVLEGEGKTATFALDRWHPIEEEWEAADVPLPLDEADLQRERERLDAQDAADTAATGYAEWEVRLDLPSHQAAVDLAERLESEGMGITRRWKFLIVGAASEDEARALVKRLQDEAPSGTAIQAQPGGEMVWEGWQKRRFAWLGDFVS